MINEQAVDVIHAVAFSAFWVFLVVGALSVSARVAFYRARGYVRPRLLSRDAIFVAGFALSFGLILLVRVLPVAVVDAVRLRDNILWALLTDAPGVFAVATFVYFELFVIERGTGADDPELRDLRGSAGIEAASEDDETLPHGGPLV